ncbi:MAG: hypothetical protein IKD04_08335 [Clostridia bacterium]|nr:hypothetical protein [Clostridia bacterium]
MDKNLIEQYKTQMLDMYRTAKKAPAEEKITVSAPPVQNSLPANQVGRLIAVVSTLRSLYPLEGARVTVFKGEPQNMQVIGTLVTDQSGRTGSFVLETPAKEISLDSAETEIPYAIYNMLVQAEGFRDNIHLNIPVFSGVTSIQRSNMMLLETAGEDKGAQIFDEAQQYNL